MDGDNTKIIEFEKWCYKCKFRKVADDKEPCNTCQLHPAKVNSQIPVKFEERKKK